MRGLHGHMTFLSGNYVCHKEHGLDESYNWRLVGSCVMWHKITATPCCLWNKVQILCGTFQSETHPSLACCPLKLTSARVATVFTLTVHPEPPEVPHIQTLTLPLLLGCTAVLQPHLLHKDFGMGLTTEMSSSWAVGWIFKKKKTFLKDPSYILPLPCPPIALPI